MTAQDYIQEQLNELKQPVEHVSQKPGIADEIIRLVLSKKFRKYSISDEQDEHIKAAIKQCVTENKPIQMTLVFGGYKLWRLKETPEADWAELFALMYYTKWMKPICAIYKPGVWFDFFSDDVIVSQMNNAPAEGIKQYQKSFKQLLDFIKPYQPSNLNVTLNRVGDQYASDAEFQEELEQNIEKLKAELPDGLPVLDDTARATLTLNVKLSDEQKTDPKWQEKVQLVHDAYAQSSKRRPYYRQPDKIMVMTTPFPGMLSVGTTKDSIMKFWVGAGVLRKKDDSYRQIIMSSNQLENGQFTEDKVTIPGLQGKNFTKVRVTN